MGAAWAAVIGSPPTIMSSALATPIRRGRRWVPPAPGRMPSLTSGWPSRAPATAQRQWQPIATSRPPPNAVPWIAATTGFGELSRRSIRSSVEAAPGGRGLPNWRMSAPAMKVRPPPISTTATTASSAAARSRPAMMPSGTPKLSALTGGFCTVMTATAPRLS